MEEMPPDIQKHFMEHTMHHKAGLFNGIWSGMAIETNFMRYGHGKNGIIGTTLKPDTVKIWTYSLHACHKVMTSLDSMRNREEQAKQTHPKEEMEARIKTDTQDRKTLREKLEVCIDALNEAQHPEGLQNIVTGKVITHPSVNADDTPTLGKSQMESFEDRWPESFHEAIHNNVNTMALFRKHIKVAASNVFDTEIIYARAVGLRRSARNYEMNKLMAYELSPQPTSMFNDSGDMRDAKTKANLKNAPKVQTSVRNMKIETAFLDRCAVLWIVPWPTNGTVQDFLDNFCHHEKCHLQTSEVYLVFYRCVLHFYSLCDIKFIKASTFHRIYFTLISNKLIMLILMYIMLQNINL